MSRLKSSSPTEHRPLLFARPIRPGRRLQRRLWGCVPEQDHSAASAASKISRAPSMIRTRGRWYFMAEFLILDELKRLNTQQ